METSIRYLQAVYNVMYKKISKHENSGLALNPVKIHLDGLLRTMQEGIVQGRGLFYSALRALYNSARCIIQYNCPNACSEVQVSLPSRMSDPWCLEQAVAIFSEISKVFESVQCVLQSDVFNCPATSRQFLRFCEEFKENLVYVENLVKEDWLHSTSFVNLAVEEPRAGKALLVRSVQGLDITAGIWGVNYPIISTSILNTQCPVWYLQDRRDILLSYHVERVEDFLAMYKTDGYTTVSDVEPFSLKVCAYSLLINDPVDSNSLFMPLGGDYSLGYRVTSLSRDQYCEIILHSRVHPDAVIISGENPVDKLRSNHLGVRSFSWYYNLPVFALRDKYFERLDLAAV